MHGSYTIRRKGALDALWTAAAPQQQRFRLVRLLGYGNIRTIRTDATHLNVLHSPVARCRPHFSRELKNNRTEYSWRSRSYCYCRCNSRHTALERQRANVFACIPRFTSSQHILCHKSQNEALITCLPGRHCHPLVDICLCPTNSR